MDNKQTVIDNLLNKMRTSAHNKGVDNVDQLFYFFSQADLDRNSCLNNFEFDKFLTLVGTHITSQERSDLFRYFDANNDKEIDQNEFAGGVLQDLNAARGNTVSHAWNSISNGRSSVPQQEVFGRFNAAAHPRVTRGQREAQDIADSFQQVFPRYASSGSVDEEGFAMYHTNLSSVIPAEANEYFDAIVLGLWGVAAPVESQIQSVEEELFKKLRSHIKPEETEYDCLLRAFRLFDANGNNQICFREFSRAIANFGCNFSAKRLQDVFAKHDADGSGSLDYEEFASMFKTPDNFAQKVKPNSVLKQVKDELIRRGAHGIRGCGIIFRRMDDNGDKHLDKYEFQWGLRENGHVLNPKQMDELFNFFDENGDGRISYDEFLKALRGDLNERRLGLVKLAYAKLDKNGDATVNIMDMKLAYDVTKHPNFIDRSKTADQILKEFMAQWDTIEKDGTVTFEEFANYYKDVSASIDGDDEFELMIRNAWHIAGGEGWCENTTIPRHLVTDPDGTQRVVMADGSDNFDYKKNLNRFHGMEV